MAKYPLTNKANLYARNIVSGKVSAGLFVRQACQRHLDDLEKAKSPEYPYKFDKEKSERFLSFGELMQHVKGKWSGQKMKWQPWQCFCFGVPFGWVKKKDGLRRFNEVLLLIPRKNGKSVSSAIVGNYMLCADNEKGAEVYSAATSEAQAYEVFRPAWLMIKKEIEFKKHFGIELMGTAVNPGNIYVPGNESRFETVIGKPGDGASPHCWLQDEYHQAKTSEAYDTGKTGMGAREQPMLWTISTAGTNTAYPCYALQKRVEKILAGNIVNDDVFGAIYSIDKDDDWTDFSFWKKANPNYNVSVMESFLLSQYKTAMQETRKQNILKCKHLNLWSNAGDAWMNMAEWHACADTSLRLSDFLGESVFIGLDLASKIDIAAKIYLFKRDDKYFLFSNYYVPESRTFQEDHAHYAGWVSDGYMNATPGSRIDIEAIQESIKKDAKDFDLSGSENGGGEVCNDPWNSQQLITNLLNEGVECVEIPQIPSFLSEPMKEIEALVKEKKIMHDGNPVTSWMVANICVKNYKDNISPFKESDENKIDGGVALITAMSRAMYNNSAVSGYTAEHGVMVMA